MPVNESIAFYDSGEDVTAFCEAAVTGRRFVAVSDPKKVASQALSSGVDGGNIVVSPCGAGAKAFGVATYDAAINALVPVMRGHKIVQVDSGAALTAGDQVMSDATGRAITWVTAASEANSRLGIVLNSPTAAGQVAIVALDL